MIKKILLGIVSLVVIAIIAVLGIALRQPDEFRVARSTTIQAPPEKIVANIEDFHRWADWSPYEKLDPNMTRDIGGAPSGKGATYAWSGNGQAGAGRMEILESSPQRVAIQLDFSEPMEGHNLAEFILTPQGDATEVAWVMSGPAPFLTKVMCVFFDLDQMIGPDFENGLAKLKKVSEQ